MPLRGYYYEALILLEKYSIRPGDIPIYAAVILFTIGYILYLIFYSKNFKTTDQLEKK